MWLDDLRSFRQNLWQVAIISASASVVVAALSFALNKRAERKAALQQRKLVHHQELLNALSDLAVDGIDKDKANQRFANAANTIALVAAPYVIEPFDAISRRSQILKS